jgi:hypothetical protein
LPSSSQDPAAAGFAPLLAKLAAASEMPEAELSASLPGGRSWPAGNPGRPAVEFHDIANAQLASAPGIRLAVHEDPAARDQFLGVRAELRKVGELQELPQPDGLISDGHVDRLVRRHKRLTF